MNTIAILNTHSGSGNAVQAWTRVRAYLEDPAGAWETQAPGHGIELTRKAIKSGAKTVIAVGGDGTINEVVNGFFENEQLISAEARLGIVPCGTGSDFQRILKLPLTDEKLAAVIQSGEVRMIDAMKVRYTQVDGAGALRYSVNVTSFGMGGLIAAKVNRSSKPLGGRIAFLLATLQTAFGFSGHSVTLKVNNAKVIDARITNVVIGNGQYHGAGMWVCPGASIQDGFLDLTIIGYLSFPELVRNLPVLYNGGIYTHPKVQAHRVQILHASSAERVLAEIDGEPLGCLPIEVSVVPQAIRVLLP